MRQRLQSFFYSRRNLAGMALALGGLTLYAVGILAAPAWIPITVGLYAVGYLLVLLVVALRQFAKRPL